MTAIGNVTVDFEANLARFTSDLQKGRAELRSFGAQANKAMARVDKAIVGATRIAGGLGVALGGAGLASFTKDVLAGAEALTDLGQRANIGLNDLQGFQYAFAQFGASTRDVNDAVTRLNRRLGLFAETGGGPAKAAIESLGLSVSDANGEMRETGEVVRDVIKKFQGIDSPARRAALASQLFGEDAGPRLAVALAQGEGAIEDLIAVAPKMDEALLNRAAEINREFENLATRIGGELKEAILSIAVAADTAFKEATGDILVFGEEADKLAAKADELREKLAGISGSGRAANRRRSELSLLIKDLDERDPTKRLETIETRVRSLRESLGVWSGGLMA